MHEFQLVSVNAVLGSQFLYHSASNAAILWNPSSKAPLFRITYKILYTYSFLIFPFWGEATLQWLAINTRYGLVFKPDINNFGILFSSDWKVAELNIGNAFAQALGVRESIIGLLEAESGWKEKMSSYYEQLLEKKVGKELKEIYGSSGIQVNGTNINVLRRFASAGMYDDHLLITYVSEADSHKDLSQLQPAIKEGSFYTKTTFGYNALTDVLLEIIAKRFKGIALRDQDLAEDVTIRLDYKTFAEAMPDLYILASHGEKKDNPKLLLQIAALPSDLDVHMDLESKKLLIQGVNFTAQFYSQETSSILLTAVFNIDATFKVAMECSQQKAVMKLDLESGEFEVETATNEQELMTVNAGIARILKGIFEEHIVPKYHGAIFGDGLILQNDLGIAETKCELSNDGIEVTTKK